MAMTDMRESTFIVSGLNCGGCVNTLTRKALGIYGVVHVDVDLDPGLDSTVVVRHADAVDPDVIGAALVELGYRVGAGSSR
jgi:copper chaperone CopZ